MQKLTQKKDWSLTQSAFQRLLNWLDGGTSSDGQKYLEMRRRLVAYFDRKNCQAPEDLADETLNRLARRLEEEGIVEDNTPARYCYIVARFVFMETMRESKRENNHQGVFRRQSNISALKWSIHEDEKQIKEKMLNCLTQCIRTLDTLDQEIITRYYIGKAREKIDNRRALAENLGISMNALSIRACRIRDKLEVCINGCLRDVKCFSQIV